MGTSKQEAQWVLRAQYHDGDALEHLLRSVQPSLHRYVRGLVGSLHADDVLQDVLIVIARKIAWLENPELLRPWAFRIASRTAFRHLKKERRLFELPVDAAALDEMPAIERRPLESTLEDLLKMDAIPPSSRAVLVLHFQEDMLLADVAAVLEVPLGTVKSRLAYGLAAIRKQLKDKRSA